MSATATTKQGLSLAGKAVFGSLCAGTFGLGVWQTQRYFEKQTLVEQRNQALALDPAQNELPASEEGSSSTSFRRIQLQGQYVHSAEVLVGPRGPPSGALPDKPGSSAAGMASAPQGYFVLTPFVPSSPAVRAVAPMIMINRGWVPRQLVKPDHRQHRQPPSTRNPNNNSRTQQQSQLLQWDRPVPVAPQTTIDVVVVPAKEEHPRFLVAEHQMNERPPQLFWFDRLTLQKWLGYKENEANNDDSDRKPGPLRLMTAVADTSSSTATANWPVAPPVDAVGQFKVDPITHAGYALTWYGLSVAGMYMTRMLITRGRG
jgi:surfeit locus 1 family protein